MPRHHRRKEGSRKYADWTNENLQNAVIEVKSKRLTLREAEEKFGIPKSTIQRKNCGKHLKKVGRPTELNEGEEHRLVEGIIILSDWGYPLSFLDLRLIVKSYMDEKGTTSTRFKNNMPGEDWVRSFLERHKLTLKLRLCQNISRSRAAVDKSSLKTYFDNLQTTIKDVKPEFIVNYDETNISDDPGKAKVITRRNAKRPERVMDHSKSSTSVMFSGSPSGVLLPPYIVYKAEHLYQSWMENGPHQARYNRSKSGWFDTVIFTDWFKTIVLPYFKEMEKKYTTDLENGSTLPKLIIGDNLSSHLSIEVIKLCEINNIRFVLFPANATHICQPLDVAYFKSFKASWKKTLTDWKLKNKGTFPKDKFPSLLKMTIEQLGQRGNQNIISGFRSCGIEPFNPEKVFEKLPRDPGEEPSSNSNWTKAIVDILKESRKKQPVIKKRKSKVIVEPGQSVSIEHFQNVNLCASTGEFIECEPSSPIIKKRDQPKSKNITKKTKKRQTLGHEDSAGKSENMISVDDERQSDENFEPENVTLCESTGEFIEIEQSTTPIVEKMNERPMNTKIKNRKRKILDDDDSTDMEDENMSFQDDSDDTKYTSEQTESDGVSCEILDEYSVYGPSTSRQVLQSIHNKAKNTKETHYVEDEEWYNNNVQDQLQGDIHEEYLGDPLQLDIESNFQSDEENLPIINQINKMEPKEGDFAIVKLLYQGKKNVEKYFVAKVKMINNEKIVCRFLRKSTKTENTFIFPPVDDEMEVEKNSIIQTLESPVVNRGRHVFKNTVFRVPI